MISKQRRDMFAELYRLAEYYENPPFSPGDIEGNCDWFVKAHKEMLVPFLNKWGLGLAGDLAFAVLDEANRLGKAANVEESVL